LAARIADAARGPKYTIPSAWAALNAVRLSLRLGSEGNRIADARLSRHTIVGKLFTGFIAMKTIATLLAVAALTLAANSADAKGCIKGAVVGGAAGHYAGHHGVLGAAAGCLYGRHHAKDEERQKQQQQQGAQAPGEKM
jgi:hypothetical protein